MQHRPKLKVCLVDMNNGVANQATRCFRRLVDAFAVRARAANPTLDVVFKHVQPRNLGELPDADTDLLLSSGGPGAPTDGFDDPWCTGYRKFLDHVAESNLKDTFASPKALLVCHSFELAVLHYGVARMELRKAKKFGLMPAYLTPAGESVDYLKPFGYRIFTWEHRNWEAIDLDEKRLRELDGEVYATETHSTHAATKGDALLAMRFAKGIDATQFHPEADKPGIMAWVEKPESREALRAAYGDDLLERMLRSMGHPDRLAKTFALFVPGWLTFRFNELAQSRGFSAIGAPELDVAGFDVAV